MSIPLVLALLIGWPFHPAQLQVKQYRVGRWSIERTLDRLTAGVRCSVKFDRMRLEGKDLVVDFGRKIDTTDSVYRIDDGLVKLTQNSEATRRLWQAQEGEARLTNPSGGLIAVPLTEIASASRLILRIDTAHQPIKLDVSGLPRVMEKMTVIGCSAP